MHHWESLESLGAGKPTNEMQLGMEKIGSIKGEYEAATSITKEQIHQ